LSVGEVIESVTTVAEGAAVETDSSENNALLTANQIEQISVKGRDVVSLLRMFSACPAFQYRSVAVQKLRVPQERTVETATALGDVQPLQSLAVFGGGFNRAL